CFTIANCSIQSVHYDILEIFPGEFDDETLLRDSRTKTSTATILMDLSYQIITKTLFRGIDGTLQIKDYNASSRLLILQFRKDTHISFKYHPQPSNFPNSLHRQLKVLFEVDKNATQSYVVERCISFIDQAVMPTVTYIHFSDGFARLLPAIHIGSLYEFAYESIQKQMRKTKAKELFLNSTVVNAQIRIIRIDNALEAKFYMVILWNRLRIDIVIQLSLRGILVSKEYRITISLPKFLDNSY
ncbi:4580_t:CDS:2, partial [Gigaspora margarita]